MDEELISRQTLQMIRSQGLGGKMLFVIAHDCVGPAFYGRRQHVPVLLIVFHRRDQFFEPFDHGIQKGLRHGLDSAINLPRSTPEFCECSP